MDFGVVGLEGTGGGLVSAGTAYASSDSATADAKQKWCGSDFLKQERSGTDIENSWRDFKMAKTSLFSAENQQQMLSFSSPNAQTVSTLPYYSRNAGYGRGGLNGGSMHGVVNGIRGPFTPSQWMELEHQALIYKYITSNVPVPSYLLNPIRKAFDSVGFSSFPGLRSNTLGWGGFHLGFSSNTDPEPGRCRRTDGKKWRCSKDSVADHKYCERHMNRGRHRSRKPVEGQPGHSVSKTTGGTITNLPVTSATSAAAVVPGGDAPNNLGFSHHQFRNYGGSEDLNDRGNESQHSLRLFMDDMPKNRSESSVFSWSNLDVQSDGTQLSISIPMANEILSSSPMKPLPELEATRMGLGLGQSNWMPVSWESSMGGPLGEALHSTNNNNTFDCKNASALNLMTEGWDSSSPGMAMTSSPTGVLQKAAFGSLSNSSAGSSPRAENNKLYNGLIG